MTADIDSIKISELKALVAGPDDVVILQVVDWISDDTAARIREYFAAAGVKAIVIGGGLTVAAVRRA